MAGTGKAHLLLFDDALALSTGELVGSFVACRVGVDTHRVEHPVDYGLLLTGIGGAPDP